MARCASAMPWMAWAGSPGASDWHSTYSDLGGWFDADGGAGIARGGGGGSSSGVPPRSRAKRDRRKVSMTKAALALMESNGKKLERRVALRPARAPRAAHVELPRLSNLVQQYVFAVGAVPERPGSLAPGDAGGALLPTVGGQECPPSPCRDRDSRTRGGSTASAATTRSGRDTSTCRGLPATAPKPADSKHLYGQLASSPIAGFPDSNRYMTESRKAQLLATNELLRRRNQALKDAHARAATLPAEAEHGAFRYLSSRAQERAAAQQPVSQNVKIAATGPAVPRRHRAAEQRIPIHLSDAVGSPTLPLPVVVEKFTRLPAYMSSGRLFADKTTNLGLQSPNGRTRTFDTTWGASLIGGARNTNAQLV